MSLIGVSGAMGTTTKALEELIDGRVTVGVAGRLGTTRKSVQDFVDGQKSIGLAGRVGCTSAALLKLRNVIGREGAIGMLVGLCIKERR